MYSLNKVPWLFLIKKKKSKEIAVKQLRLKSNNMKEIGKKVEI